MLFWLYFSVLHKAGRHMEDTLIASYITLIIGYLILDDKVIFSKSFSKMCQGTLNHLQFRLNKQTNFKGLTFIGFDCRLYWNT